MSGLAVPLFPRLLVVLAALSVGAGCVDAPSDPEEPGTGPEPDAALVAFFDSIASGREVVFDTDHGTIRMIVYEDVLPQTTAHFIDLVASGFHNGTIIHRVVDDFVIQGGDPSGTGQLGSGETVPLETHTDLQFGGGAVGLARDLDPDSGDSQWFITEKPQPHLHDPSVSSTGAVFGAYAIFAQVIEGMDVVRSIAAVQTIPGLDRPVEDVELRSALVKPAPTDVDLLNLPVRVVSGTGPTYAYDLELPLQLFANHTFPATVYVAPQDGTPAPMDVRFTTTDGERMTEFALQPLSDDAWTFRGDIMLETGTYGAFLSIGDNTDNLPLAVHPWHDAYNAYTGHQA